MRIKGLAGYPQSAPETALMLTVGLKEVSYPSPPQAENTGGLGLKSEKRADTTRRLSSGRLAP